jgi:hypothetical protein
MKKFRNLAAVGCLAWSFVLADESPPNLEPEARDIGNRRQVFIDNRFVEDAVGVRLVVHQPVKTKELTLAPEHPWEKHIGAYSTVIKVGDTYHLWYDAITPRPQAPDAGAWQGGLIRSLAYARSRDGIRWEKPELGLTEILGTRKNNVVLGYGAGGIQGGLHSASVFLDPNAPEAERFRLLAYVVEMPRALQLFSSHDGIHWRLTHRSVIVFESEKHHLDSQNIIFWDDQINKYAAYIRRNLRPAGSQGRVVARSESAHLGKFTNAEDSPVVLAPDGIDPQYFDSVENRYIPLTDFYTGTVIKDPWAQDAYYMFPAHYYHYSSRFHSEFKGEKVFDFEGDGQDAANAGPLDIRLAASRDGIKWLRYDRRPFVELGMKGEWDSKSLYMVQGLVPALNDREMYLYYQGSDRLHGWGYQPQSGLLDQAGLGSAGQPDAITRVVLRRDGFISVRGDYAGGQFTTPLVRFQGNQLVLNVNTSAVGTVQVEILDELGNPIPGFRLQDCDRIHTTNEVNRPVTWNRQSDVSRLTGQPVRIRFVLFDADLYAFQFR